MPQSNPMGFDSQIKNIARGSDPYRAHRWRIGSLIHDAPPRSIKPLPVFLGKRLFKVDAKSWMALTFSDRDWKQIERLGSDGAERYLPAYASLAVSCLLANADGIKTVYEFDRAFSATLLSDGTDAAAELIKAMPAQSHQSLYSFRLMAALNSGSGDGLLKFFRDNYFSDWFKQRFLYPFVYYFLNIPPDKFMDFHMSIAMPPGHENATERNLIQLLLRDEVAYDTPLSVKLYAGLVCHPFDLCEIIVNHLEFRLTQPEKLSLCEQELAEHVAQIAPSWRLPSSLFTAPGSSADRPELKSAADIFGLTGQAAEALDKLFSLHPLDLGGASDLSDNIRALINIRNDEYPSVKDYDHVIALSRGYHGTLLGRTLTALLTSLYLLPRREPEYEILNLHRLSKLAGGITPFVAASPRGRFVPRSDGRPPDESDGTTLQAMGIPPKGVGRDRTWIKLVHWNLMALERDGRFLEWLDVVRKYIPVAPAYLTGIDWSWFEASLARSRLGPLRGSPSAAYTLLLQHIEERRREVNALRLVLEPTAEGAGTVSSFVGRLVDDHGDAATAFVRFFLTADMALWLGLSKNYTAALTERMAALDQLAIRFKLEGPVLNEETWIQEQRALNNALIMSNISVNQFDISWDVITRDTQTRNAGLFDAYLTVSPADEGDSPISLAKTEVPHQFPNGQSEKYVIVAREFPLLNVVLGVVDAFLEHPSQGIEAVLSIRIRHNNFRREIIQALQSATRGYMKNIPASDRAFLVPLFEPAITDVIQRWLDRRMHQRRPGKPDGLFNFVPDQVVARQILDEMKSVRSFGPIAERVVLWLRQSLVDQLAAARQSVAVELRSEIVTAVRDRASELQAGGNSMVTLEPTADVIIASVGQRLDELTQWFACPTGDAAMTVSYADISAVVEERFQSEIVTGAIVLSRLVDRHNPGVKNDHVRMLFNIWNDIVENVIKHSGLKSPRLRVFYASGPGSCGLLFSSDWAGGRRSDEDVSGHPYETASDALFREGNSGLNKVASLAASIAGSPVSVRVSRRGQSFHVYVPLSLNNSGGDK